MNGPVFDNKMKGIYFVESNHAFTSLKEGWLLNKNSMACQLKQLNLVLPYLFMFIWEHKDNEKESPLLLHYYQIQQKGQIQASIQ